MREAKEKIKITTKKFQTNDKTRSLEMKIEVDKKLFQGTDWLESLKRLKPLDEYLKDALTASIKNYILEAEQQLIGSPQKQEEAKTPTPKLVSNA